MRTKSLVKEVFVAYNPDHYLANKEAYAAKSKAWRLANPERAKENRRRNYEENKQHNLDYSTKYNRHKKTGVTDEQYQQQLVKQQGLCAICGGSCTKALAADHCHSSGVFRGLLCNNCNRGLGHFKDSPALLYNAMKYLERGVVPQKPSATSVGREGLAAYDYYVLYT